MLRKLLLPMLATSLLAGCATDYRYRGGNGDYYYGQPRVQYRYQGPGGYYGSFGLGYGYSYGYGYGGLGARYYYDRFGRLVFGYPGYYGSPYYRGHGWNLPRPHQGGRDDHDDSDDHNHHNNTGNNDGRRPPWRDFGGLQQRDDDGNDNGYRDRDERQRPIRRERPASNFEAPIRQQRAAPGAPMVRERSNTPSRTSGFSGGATRPQGKRTAPPEE